MAGRGRIDCGMVTVLEGLQPFFAPPFVPDFYQAMWIFIFYSFVGWCCEVVYAAICLGKFVNRGFLNGPVCPIYGFGMLVVIIALTPISRALIMLFTGSMLLTSALEFIAGFVLEKYFDEKWWDYSDEHFNLKGYVCLKFSLLWGLGCVFVMKIIQPIVMTVITDTESPFGWSAGIFFLFFVVTDTVLTVTATVRMKNRLHSLDEITARIKVISDKIGGQLADGTLTFMEKYEEGRENLSDQKGKYAEELTALKEKMRGLTIKDSPIGERIFRSFPQLQNGIHGESIKKLIEKWSQETKERVLSEKNSGKKH